MREELRDNLALVLDALAGGVLDMKTENWLLFMVVRCVVVGCDAAEEPVLVGVDGRLVSVSEEEESEELSLEDDEDDEW